MTELELVQLCLYDERLDESSQNAFRKWALLFEQRRLKTLSPKQREWLERVCERLGIDPGAANWVTNGRVKPSANERAELGKFYESLGPKPLKPPGRA